MAFTVLTKRSSVASAVPTVGQLSPGEIAVNTFDGRLFFIQNSGTASVITLGSVNTALLTGLSTATSTNVVATDSVLTGIGKLQAQITVAAAGYNAANVAITGGAINNTRIGNVTPTTGVFTTLSATTSVSGNGFNSLLAAPTPIGNATPNTGAFTTLSATTSVSGNGFNSLLGAPTPIGNTTPNTGAFTTLSASGTVSGNGFNSLLGAPTPIGNTTPNTGAFTTLSATGNITGTGFTNLLAPYMTSATANTTYYLATNPSSYQTGAQVASALGAYALLANPALTGTPTAPTATAGANTTQIATTAFVQNAAAGYAVSITAAAPTSPITGAEWWNTNDGKLYIYTGTAWAEANNETVPVASTSVVGAVAIGAGMSITSAGTLSSAGANMGRNQLLNARFLVQQRGTGPWTTANSYTADRWLLGLVGDTNSASIATLSDADRTAIGDEYASYAWQDVVTGSATAANFSIFTQHMEDVRRLSNKTVTISFYAKASATLNVGVYMQQVFGTGGSPSTAVSVAPTTLALTTTWTRYSATFAVPSISGKTLGSNNDHYTSVGFGLSSGSTNAATLGVGVQSGTFSFFGVQCEIGTLPTTLESRQYSYELQACQRYYFSGQTIFSGYGVTSTPISQATALPTPMRTTPTIAQGSNTISNLSSVTTNAALTGLAGVLFSATVTATGNWSINTNWTASADL